MEGLGRIYLFLIFKKISLERKEISDKIIFKILWHTKVFLKHLEKMGRLILIYYDI